MRVKNFREGQKKWPAATAVKRLGPVAYQVQEGDRRRSVHIDHLLPRRGEIQNPLPICGSFGV